MRTCLVLLALAAPASVHADASVNSPATPRTPLGARCDAALGRAQREFLHGFSGGIRFHVRERVLVGKYEWSDRCGVWGNYTVELARDGRAAHEWRWKSTSSEDKDDGPKVRLDGTRRVRGWRATFRVEGDSASWAADSFVDAFRPALDACLEEASAASR